MRRGLQRYRCGSCDHQFQSARKPHRRQRAILTAYVWRRQTVSELATLWGKSARWVRTQIHQSSVHPQTSTPQPTPVAADMTFWGRGYGICVFRSPTLKQNLWWTEAAQETAAVYAQGLDALLAQGWTITGVVLDGRRGVAQVFAVRGIPVQYCQFHQMKTVTRYLTRRPKTDAACDLRALALLLPTMTEATCKAALLRWHEQYAAFLTERSPAPHRKWGWDYTHRRVRAAYRSLMTNLQHLFTYQRYPERGIPNTTNTLDGMFSQLKNRLAVHRGLRRDRRYMVITEILQGKRTSASQKFH